MSSKCWQKLRHNKGVPTRKKRGHHHRKKGGISPHKAGPYIISGNKRPPLSNRSGAGLFLYTRRNSRGSYHRARAANKQRGPATRKKEGPHARRKKGTPSAERKGTPTPQRRRAEASRQLERQLGANTRNEKILTWAPRPGRNKIKNFL